MNRLEIQQVPVLTDNYAYLLHEPETGATAALDPSEGRPLIEAARARGWHLTHVINTHHHWDHVGGNLTIKEATGATIVGPRPDIARIPGIDETVEEGVPFRLGLATAQILFIPGHTRGHMAFHFEDSQALFCGDTLFALGCGRLFEGSPEEMWDSLQKLRRLPPETLVYCGHEYTEANARFAVTVDPANETLAIRALAVAERRAEGLPTVPSAMAEERATNPFLRADAPSIAQAINLPRAPAVEVFAEIRRRKDRF